MLLFPDSTVLDDGASSDFSDVGASRDYSGMPEPLLSMPGLTNKGGGVLSETVDALGGGFTSVGGGGRNPERGPGAPAPDYFPGRPDGTQPYSATTVPETRYSSPSRPSEIATLTTAPFNTILSESFGLTGDAISLAPQVQRVTITQPTSLLGTPGAVIPPRPISELLHAFGGADVSSAAPTSPTPKPMLPSWAPFALLAAALVLALK